MGGVFLGSGGNGLVVIITGAAAPTPAPTVTAISPSTGSTAGGTSVTITGTNFSGTPSVTIGGVAATSVVVNSATSITCTTPPGIAGARDVVVTVSGQSSTGGTGLFTFAVPPNLTRDQASVTVNEGGTLGNAGTVESQIGNPVTVTATTGTISQTNTGVWTLQSSLSVGGQSGDLALDSDENVYVSIGAANIVKKYSSSGSLLTSWTVTGAAGLAVDRVANVIYVVSLSQHKVFKYSLTGTLLATLGSTAGSANGQFNEPYNVALDSAQNVYVTENLNSRVQVFDSSGNYLRKWGTNGTGDGQFSWPQGIAINSADVVYVVDRLNNRVQYFSSTGTFQGKWGTNGSGNGQFNQPAGIGIDPSGNVFVGDTFNNRLQKFTAAGVFVDKFGPSSGGSALSLPHATVFPQQGRSIYVGNYGLSNVLKFATPGTWSWSLATTDGPAGPTPVTITATDNTTGISSSTTFNMTVNNVAPTIAVTGNATTLSGVSYTLNLGAKTDPGTDTVSSYSIDWGDGSSVDTFSGNPAGLSKTHTFTTAGSKSISVSLTDEDGTFASAGTLSVTVQAPEIVVEGNSTNIVSGTTSASITDHTQFGSVALVGGTLTRTFTVRNTGTANLNLSGTPKVVIGGTNAADFTVTVQPSGTVAPAGSTMFDVAFDPSAVGTRQATVSIANNDSDENPFTFALEGTGINNAPTDITLTPSSIAENNAANATVGTLSAVDADVGQTHVFTKVAGTGDTDNSSFTISGTSLILIPSADFETKSSYSIRVQADDGNSGIYAKALTVTVTNVNEAPTISDVTDKTTNEDVATTAIPFTISDPDAGTTFNVSATSSNTTLVPNGNVVLGGSSTSRTVTITPAANLSGTTLITLTVSDGTLSATDTFTLTVNSVNDAPSFAINSAALTGVNPGILAYGIGTNGYGQLGANSGANSSSVAVPVANVSDFIQVSSGDYHSIGLASDGSVWVWGRNDAGQLANGVAVDDGSPNSRSRIPLRVAGLSDVVQVDAGFSWNMALKADGSVWTWGINSAGQLGLGATSGPVLTPTNVPGLTGIQKIVAAGGTAYALKSDGTLWTWGVNGNGQLGRGTAGVNEATPAVVTALGSTVARLFTAVSAHVFVERTDGTIWTWGTNYFGQGGTGASEVLSNTTPTRVTALGAHQVLTMAAGQSNSFAVMNDGTVKGFGANHNGFELGLGGGSAIQTTPVTVPGLTNIVAVSAGAGGVALNASGNVFTWGLTGAPSAPSTPTQVASLSNITAVSCGQNFFLMLGTPPPMVFYVVVTEDAGAQSVSNVVNNVSPGPADESAQTVNFTVTNTNNALFSVQPAISSNGTLTYTLAPNANGLATISVTALDDGGMNNGGVNTSAAQTFPIKVTPINDTPTDIVLSTSAIAENNAANATVGTLSTTDVDVGDAFIYALVTGAGSTDNGSFTIAGNALKLTPSANFELKNSYAIRVRSTDTGTQYFEKEFTINITDVNELPTFTKGSNPIILTTSLEQTITGWASAIDDGDSTAVQGLTFTVTEVGSSGIFSVAPSINSSTGTLTFTPNGTSGTATFNVTLTDDNTINGNAALTTLSQTLTITVQPQADYSVTTTGNVVVVTDVSGNSDTLSLTDGGAFATFAAAGRIFSLNGGLNQTGSINLAYASYPDVTSIVVNAGGGDDTVNIGDFSLMQEFAGLVINGDGGTDTVNFTGGINPAGVSATAEAITVSGAVRSTAGNFTLTAANGVVVSGTADSGPGALNINADSDADGSGTLAVNAAGALYGTTIVVDAADVDIASTATVGNAVSGALATTFVDSTNGLNYPTGMEFDTAGNLYAVNNGANSVFKITPAGTVSTFASSATLSGVGLTTAEGLAINAAGDLFITNASNNNDSVIRVTSAGVASSFATGVPANHDLAIDVSGNLYMVSGNTDTATQKLSRITSAGVVSTLVPGNILAYPTDVLLSPSGDLFVAGWGSGLIYRVTQAGAVSTFANLGGHPARMDFDSAGNIFVIQQGGSSVYKVTPAGVVSTYYTGSLISGAGGIVLDSAGIIYVGTANTIVKVAPANVLTTAVTIRPSVAARPISLGSTVVGALSLTDAELDRVAGQSVTIGSASSGAVTFSQPISPAGTASLFLVSNGSIKNTNASGTTLTVASSASRGTLAPGASPGRFSIVGNHTLATGSTFAVEIGGVTAGTDYDQLDVTGTVTISSNVTLSLSALSGFIPDPGNSFVIINNDGSDPVSGTFNGIAEGDTIAFGSVNLVLSYAGGTGNDVVLTRPSLLPLYLGMPGGTGGGSGGGTASAPDASASGSLGRWESIRQGAVLASNGGMAFRGHMELGTGTPPVTVDDFQGIWKFDGTDTRLKARSGSIAPDTGNAVFDILPYNPAITPNGLITFYGTLRLNGPLGVTPTNNAGVWSEIGGGALRLLLRKGDTIVPGKTFRSSSSVVASNMNTAALNAKLSSGSALIHLDVNTPSVLLTVLAEEGKNAPGGGIWGALDGNAAEPRLSASGDLGFVGEEVGEAGTSQGIYSRLRTTAVGTSGLVVEARVGATAPGTSGATFSRFERPTVFDGGMAFRGFLNADGDNAAGNRSQGVWAGAFGSLAPVVRTGDTNAQIPTIPAGSTVTSVWSPFSNTSGAITMRVALKNAGPETRAIIGSTSGTMRVIAKHGDSAPGLPGETFINFDHPVIGDGNQVAFTALTDGGNYGIWKQAPGGGALTLVTKVGDTISTSEGDKVVAQITLPGATTDDRKFENRCMDAAGRLLIHVTYPDTSTSLLLGQ